LKLASALDHWATQMDMGRKPDPKSLTRKASAELRRLQAELDGIKQALTAPVQPVKPSLWEQYHAAQPAPVQEPVAWYEHNPDLDAWFLAYTHNPKVKSRPLVFGDTTPFAQPAPVQEPVAIDGNTSDGYHTFNELYEFRKAYNAALFNEWAAGGKCSVHKSWRHHDGELCFGGGWFIVVAVLPDGQISNHYEAKDWDLFAVPETERALFEFDGHTGADVVERLKTYTTPPAQPAPVQEPVQSGLDADCIASVVSQRYTTPPQNHV
jgi:hypothetical protein